MKKIIYITTFLIIAIILNACAQTNNENEKIIYTSIYPIQYIVEQIGDESITSESIYPPGVDAHSYEPSSREITEIAKGKAFFYLGAGMEGFAETVADSLDNQEVNLIEIATMDESLFYSGGHHQENDDHNYGDKDPHIWLDPIRMIQMGEIIRDELSAIFPEQKESFETNFRSFETNMTELDNEFSKTLSSKENKKILVAHAAYGYWEKRYELEQIAISGLSTNDEPSQKELTDIINMAKKHHLNYVIFEQTGTDKVSEIIRKQIDAKPSYIHNLESLTEEDIDNNDDYLSIMRKNLEVLDKVTN